ncbi:hypothetical protein V6N11_028869 [Hibiscus sabdariffa]|uniref:Uncharacterized protein n=1 Tax=Hibiscus sabdariffa TaxID=183260 RepID=A0ABR2PR59_9ROSI
MVESRCVLVPGHWAGVFGHQWSIPCLINLAGGSFLGFGAYKAREPSIQVCELPALPPVAHPGFTQVTTPTSFLFLVSLFSVAYRSTLPLPLGANSSYILTSLLPHNRHLYFPVQFPWFFLAVLFPAIPYPRLTLMDPELVHSMENLQFTEAESSSIVVDSPYEERDSTLWLVGSVITTKLKPMAGPRKKSGIEYFDSSAPMKATAAHVGEATAAPVGEASARYTGMVVWLKLPPATDGLDQPAPSDSSLPLRAAVEGQCAESVLTDKVVDSIATRSDPTDAAAKIVVDIVAAPLAPVVTTTDPPQKVAASL